MPISASLRLPPPFSLTVMPATFRGQCGAIRSPRALRRRQGRAKRPASPSRRGAARAPVASFWTSPEPTFDEGTYDRINAAMLSYAAIEVRGGWPTLAEGHCSSPA